MAPMDLNRLVRAGRESSIIYMALWAHQGQLDKAGQPYIYHPWRVANRVAREGGSYRTVAAAWLHDVLEDSNITESMMEEAVGPEITRIVLALTHHRWEPYSEFIDRVLSVPGAKSVKRADILDNLDPKRLMHLDEETQARLRKKYVSALEQLVRG